MISCRGLSALLSCQAKRYERRADRADTRAGSYERKLVTKAGELKLKVPRLRSRRTHSVQDLLRKCLGVLTAAKERHETRTKTQELGSGIDIIGPMFITVPDKSFRFSCRTIPCVSSYAEPFNKLMYTDSLGTPYRAPARSQKYDVPGFGKASSNDFIVTKSPAIGLPPR